MTDKPADPDAVFIFCRVYKTRRKPGLYLYVDRQHDLSRVPAELLAQFVAPELALEFKLSAGRALAQQDPVVVLNNVREQGYHLQLPPATHGSQPGRNDKMPAGAR